MTEKELFDDKLSDMYLRFVKKQTLQKEAFLIKTILPKLKLHHKLLFKLHPRLIKNVITQIEQGERYAFLLYGKVYWMNKN